MLIVGRKLVKASILKSSTRCFSSTPNVIQIDYQEIVDQPKSLFAKIEEAYGDSGIGAMIVKNIPGYVEKRKNLLPYAQRLARLEAEVLASLESPEYFYSIGWSHGREKFKGKPDMLKASYYASPLADEYQMADSSGKEGTIKNKWPEPGVLDGFEDAFKALGQHINSVGVQLSKNLDMFIKSRHSNYKDGTLEKQLKESTRTTGRLLHYFPVSEKIDITDMKWCGWHNDHGTLTGLCSAMYLDENFDEVHPNDIEDDVSGLFAMTRDHQEIKIKIPQDCLAFQIGETAQILSGGLLCATPHSVVCKPNTDGISRNTFALFMEPNQSEILKVPEGLSPDLVYRKDPTNQVPEIGKRWKQGIQFGKFEHKTFELYYKSNEIEE